MSTDRTRRFAVLVEALETADTELQNLATRPDVARIDRVRLSRLGGSVSEIEDEVRRITRRYDDEDCDAQDDETMTRRQRVTITPWGMMTIPHTGGGTVLGWVYPIPSPGAGYRAHSFDNSVDITEPTRSQAITTFIREAEAHGLLVKGDSPSESA